MRVPWVVASMALLIPAIAGCRTAPPTPEATVEVRETAGLPKESPRPLTKSPGAEEITLVSHQAAEPLPIPRKARPPLALTLADFERIALANNPTLPTAASRVVAAQGKRLQAGLLPNPVIGYHATEIFNRGTAGQQGAFISQRWITAGKQRLDQAVASREIQEARFLFDAQQQRVLSDVRIRFYDALTAQRRLELTGQLARIGDELAATSDKLHINRQISENDLLQAEIEAEKAHILHENTRNENTETWRRLTALIGNPTMALTPLAGDLQQDLPSYAWDECFGMVLDQNPAIQAARARVQRARIALERARREKIPNIDVSVSVRHHNVTGSDVANVQVGIPLPIFDANQGNVRKAQAQWIGAQQDVRRIELDLQDRLAVEYRRYENARHQVERYSKRILTRARKSLDLVTNGYEKGQVNYLTLITTQQTYFLVNLAYLDALGQLHESLEAIQGQLLTGSLSQR